MNMMMAIAQQRRRRKEFDPLSLSPALWYSDTGDDPAMWEDLSGFSRHATQGNETSQPELVTDELNGR